MLAPRTINATTSSPRIPVNVKHSCWRRVESVKYNLEMAGLPSHCQPLQTDRCDLLFEDLASKATPESVEARAASCEEILPTETRNMEEEERNHSLAFIIQVYKDARNLELILGAVFRPHNSYCLHVDPKSSAAFQSTVSHLVSCYNAAYPSTALFVAAGAVPVYWGHVSMLEADLVCMEELYARSSTWLSVVNMAGSEFPRVSNLEMVRRAVNHAVVRPYVTSTDMNNSRRWKTAHFKWKLLNRSSSSWNPEAGPSHRPVYRSSIRHSPVPYNLRLYQGIRSFILSRTWAHFILHHRVAKEFLDWCRDTYMPEEHFIQTLARVNIHTIDSKVEQDRVRWPFYGVRMTLWNFMRKFRCHGKWRNWICVLTLEDLPFVLQKHSTQIIVNKFSSELDPVVVPCLMDLIQQNNSPTKSP